MLCAVCSWAGVPAGDGSVAQSIEADKRGRTGLEDAPYPQGAELQRLFAAACTVKANDVAAGLSGTAVGEAMRKARTRAIGVARGETGV